MTDLHLDVHENYEYNSCNIGSEFSYVTISSQLEKTLSTGTGKNEIHITYLGYTRINRDNHSIL